MPSVQSYFFRQIMRFSTREVRGATPVERMRAQAERGTRAIKPPREATVQTETADGVPAYWVSAPGADPERVILYIHGGGFILGWNNQYFGLLTTLSKASHARTLGIDYRLAPEHPFPAALDDCVTAYRWLLKQGIAPAHIVIAGDSAGGNLVLTTLLALREQGLPQPAAAVAISPATDFTGSGESYTTRAKVDPVLRVDFTQAVGRYYGGDTDPQNPLLSPLYGDLHGLPPLLLHAGADEILLSDAERFAAKAQVDGVAVTLHVWPHMWHVFHIFGAALPEARLALAEIGAFAYQHLTTPVTVSAS
jgi:acetyl esterase/lipase